MKRAARSCACAPGQSPLRESQCSDGAWQVTATSFKFTREVPVPRPHTAYPLEYAKASQ